MEKSHSIVAHQFDDIEQQRDADSLGMWVFLATEILFFGGMFMAYTVYRHAYPLVFAEASKHMDVILGGINTGVLLGSSLTVALAVHAAKEGNRHALIRNLLITILLGLVFLGIKAFEYHHKFVDHLVPGIDFQYPGAEPHKAVIYFFLYFVMTGIHALHLIIGVGVMSFILRAAIKNRYSPEYHTPVEVGGLYWHFVDIVWIFLYPLIYLIDVHK